MKRPAKRYTTRKSILDAMETHHHEQANDLKLICQYETEIDSLKAWFALHPNGVLMSSKQSEIWHGKFGRLKLCNNELAIRKRSLPRHQQKLNVLKAVLAEFLTQPMSFLEDGGVVAK